MRPSIGILGVFGLLLALAGIGLIAYVDPLLAAGLVAIIVGLGLVVTDLFKRLLASFGMGGFP